MKDKKYEIRKIDVKEFRAESLEKEGKRYLIGKIPYESLSGDLGGFKEKIQRGAFNKTISDSFDVKALINHDASQILGRIKNNTLTLEDREDGLYCTVELGNQSYANDLWESVSRDDVSTLSFGFRVIKDEFTRTEDEVVIRTLKEVHLIEVSYGVTFPAYDETDSQAVYRDLYRNAGIDFDVFNNVLIKIRDNEKLSEEELSLITNINERIKDQLAEETEAIEEEPPASTPLSILDEELTLIEKELI